jgi:hypothetical protein
MKIEDIKPGNVVTSMVDEGAGFLTTHGYRVLRVNRLTVTVRDYYGHKFRIRPELLNGKIDMSLDKFYGKGE